MVLDACIKNKIPSDEVAGMVIAIFSDMEIDCLKENPWQNKDLSDEIDALYKTYGYNRPHLLFWNLRKSSGFPTLSSKNNCTMLSGYSSSLLNVFCNRGIEGLKEFNPRQAMEDLLSNARYNVMEEDLICHLGNNFIFKRN